MKLPTRQLRHKRSLLHTFYGPLHFTGELIEWLNQKPEQEARISLTSFISALKRIEDSWRAVAALQLSAEARKGLGADVAWIDENENLLSTLSKTNQVLLREFTDAFREIRRALRGRTYRPIFMSAVFPFVLQWIPEKIEHPKHPKKAGQTSLSEEQEISFWYLFLIQMAGDGLIGKLSQCLRCKKWYRRAAAHQVYCSTSCRQQHFSRREQQKEHRRRYMINYRARQKYQDQQALSTARKLHGKK